MSLSEFMHEHFRHFNSGEALRAAQAWAAFRQMGGQMVVTLAGAMSTAEIGKSLARLICRGDVSAICSTGANMEEDLFRLVGGHHYHDIPRYRQLSNEDESLLADQNLHRVTDTCIPYSAMKLVEDGMIAYWQEATATDKSFFPDEFASRFIDEWRAQPHDPVRLEQSWVAAACAARVPIFTPGWEDSSLGCTFAALVMDGTLAS